MTYDHDGQCRAMTYARCKLPDGHMGVHEAREGAAHDYEQALRNFLSFYDDLSRPEKAGPHPWHMVSEERLRPLRAVLQAGA